MVISANEIKDEESLEEWLEDKSLDAMKVLATRCALRFMPVSFLELDKSRYNNTTLEARAQIILTIFRANFISWTARIYPFTDLIPAAENAQSTCATLIKSYHADSAIKESLPEIFTYVILKTSLNATISNTSTDTYISVYDDDFLNGSHTYSMPAVLNTVKVSDDYTKITWEAIKQDATWLEENAFDAEELMYLPLFHRSTATSKDHLKLENNMLYYLQTYTTFAYKESPAKLQRPLTLIAAWYGMIFPMSGKPHSLLGRELDIKLATQPNEFWEGDPIEALNRVADLVGWEVPGVSIHAESIEENDEELSIEEITPHPNQSDNQVASSLKIDPKMVSENRATIALNLESVLLNIENERKLLGDQPNEEEKQQEWNRKSDFLDQIETTSQNSLDLLLEASENNSKDNDKKVALLLEESLASLVDILRSNNRVIIEETLRSAAALSLIALLSWIGVPVLLGSIATFAQTSSDSTWNRFTGIFPDIWNRKPPPE